ncbi:MAG: hypothetical protein L6Q99_07060 [Planctomycetes bacterium]|nr:hypothetical protein [Planctomycetota bacterium]
MHHEPQSIERRTVLQLAAGLAAASSLGANLARADARKPQPTGKPGDFDFLTGKWKIANEFRTDEGWIEFEGEATVFSILSGTVSVEELRIPARNFFGMGLRLLDPKQKLWADHWVNSVECVITPPPAWGSFVDGVGTWDGDDVLDDKSIIVRGAWDRITPKSCRWYQATSRDDGRTWEENWVMHWTRV